MPILTKVPMQSLQLCTGFLTHHSHGRSWWHGGLDRVTRNMQHCSIYKETRVGLRKANTVYLQNWSSVPKRANVGEAVTEKKTNSVSNLSQFPLKMEFLVKVPFYWEVLIFYDLKTIPVLYWGTSTAISSMGGKDRERSPTHFNLLIWVLIWHKEATKLNKFGSPRKVLSQDVQCWSRNLFHTTSIELKYAIT